MNDKQKLAAMGAQYRLTEEQAKGLAERMPQTGALQVIDDEPLCTEIRINGVEACGADIGGLLDRCLPHTTEQKPLCMAKRIEELEAQYDQLQSKYKAALDLLSDAKKDLSFARDFDPEMIRYTNPGNDPINRIDAMLAGHVPNHISDVSNMVPEGWQPVPVEPTREMMASAMSAVTQPQDLLYSQSGWGMNELAARTRYCAMLAAAPKLEAK